MPQLLVLILMCVTPLVFAQEKTLPFGTLTYPKSWTMVKKAEVRKGHQEFEFHSPKHVGQSYHWLRMVISPTPKQLKTTKDKTLLAKKAYKGLMMMTMTDQKEYKGHQPVISPTVIPIAKHQAPALILAFTNPKLQLTKVNMYVAYVGQHWTVAAVLHSNISWQHQHDPNTRLMELMQAYQILEGIKLR